MCTIPSFNHATAIPTNLRDSLSCLDVVWSDMFETGDSVNDWEVAMTDFLKGAPAQWRHFNTSESSPFVERDVFKKLIQLIERKKRKSCLITEVSLQYKPGSGGSTLAMQVLWHFRKDLRCARVIDPDLDAKKLPKQVVDLFLLSNEQHAKRDQKTVLLLLDTKENTNNDQPIKNTLWENLIDEIQKRDIKTDTPAVIILNCRTADFPTTGSVAITMTLSSTEKMRFDQKRQELEEKYKERSQNFHAFNIMQGGFKKEDAEKVITAEMVEHVKNHPKSKSTRLLSFLALINSYVPGSHLSRLSCEEFIAKTGRSSDEENAPLETTMKPFMDLIVIFSEGKPVKTDYIRMVHPMIADACVKMLTVHKLTRFDIASDFLNSMVKGKERNYMQICKRMLTDRLDTEKYKFSKLILDLLKDKSKNAKQCIDLLKLASDLFTNDPFYPQALARLYYIEVNKYDEAKRWANIAIDRDPKKSHIRDTLGRVHKNHLWNTKTWTETVLNIAKSAIKAFQEEEKAAEDESEDNTSFNNRGYFGFLQVCKGIYDLPKKPLEQKCSKFISGLEVDVKKRYDFFEWYLAFSRPRINKKDPDYFQYTVEECYKRYFKKEKTDEATLNEKKMKSFGGLLHFLKPDVSVLQQTFKNPQSDDETQNILYVLANIILSMSDKQSENIEELQASLQKLWVSKKQGRSPEFYFLILLLFWFDEAQPGIPNPPDLEDCVKYMGESYEKKYRKYLRGRYLVPLFFFGTENGLQRLVHSSKLQTLIQTTNQNDDGGALEFLLEGDKNVNCLQRITGEVKMHNKVFAIRDGKQIQVTPHKPASVYKQGKVSFYLGFNIRGPVAFSIRYTEILVHESSS
ncbi:sterile alpha motif domain-containing protein 9-like [Ctenopharyngodon idella]|uniref:sterile alpha motif domain-containing protein 9-like n=1 Tax=Ctenopharyngodon idella TaxID=7959 RepID=UPI00222FE9A7|nr:sterile alpha motif domain-containing protein 9-like [Ctenopharyngodon idella]XP_051731192.1 sterile alpha motif domain-containing protein 9-like [Ctenopharyngodon idella]